MLSLLPILLLLTSIATAQPDQTELTSAVVNRVIDGDTLDAQIDGIRTPVGYVGVESPRLNQPCGQEALARNAELAAGGVLLEPDAAYQGVDQRRRILYHAYTADGISIDETLISEGLARAARTDAARGEQLAALEAATHAAQQGCLWAS